MKKIVVLILLMIVSCAAYTQPWLTGKIFKKASTEVLAGVTVHNLHTSRNNTSDAGGNYKIEAHRGISSFFLRLGTGQIPLQ